MGTVTLEEFLPQIRSNVPGCPDDVMKASVLDACIRFCNDSWIIREDIEPGNVTAGVDDYLIIPSQYSRMVSLISLMYNGVELPKVTEEELDYLDPGWRNGMTGTATYVIMTAPDRLKLNRIPEETIVQGFVPRIVTRPSHDAPFVNDRLYTDWKKAIKYGALSDLLEIPGKKWSDIKLSQHYGERFSFETQRAKDRAQTGWLRKSTVAKPRSWI
jgi:hypothetical protein